MKLFIFLRRYAAFTLIEALVVVSIVAILAVSIIPEVRSAKVVGRGKACGVNLKLIELAKDAWQKDHPGQPATVNDLLIYLHRPSLPSCPDGGVYSGLEIGEKASCSLNGVEGHEPKGSANSLANGCHDSAQQ